MVLEFEEIIDRRQFQALAELHAVARDVALAYCDSLRAQLLEHRVGGGKAKLAWFG